MLNYQMARKVNPPPMIDDDLEFRGPSWLRNMTGTGLRNLSKVVVLQDGPEAERLAVLIPYERYRLLKHLTQGEQE